MDKELKKYLEWLNENLKAVVSNQYVLCLELKKIEDVLLSKDSSMMNQK